MSAAWVMLNVRNVPKVVTRLGRAASHAAVGPERTTLPADAAAIFRKDESVGLRIDDGRRLFSFAFMHDRGGAWHAHRGDLD